ncbi:uncharacterized protein LOC121855461 [Homarus americanus]|uniref:EF-hand domain-containing protein n=1 Tax=Homarus americanus TaxID=6706 RepID=A0A8J5JA10_HOMAM|nr:uncharacterized protein LOC121855461 [Homarus americanus]KAG7155097.1 hypothetical protein Hamer_G015705 [Homarus americanus]QPB70558.1 putative ecdysis triggering hormone precursor [Homarus americanus]
MASTQEGSRTGMAWLVVAVVLSVMVNLVHSDAGHFFAETPKHLPRIGRRGDLPPLSTLLTEDVRSSGKPARGMTDALAQLDSDGDGCIGIAELLRIPIVRVAILLQNPALITPDATTDTEENDTGEAYTTDHRPEPRLLRYLHK